MKVVILAGGFGTRISEESYLKPKPMIGIGEMPIIWHIMKNYSHFGFNEFVICLGYKGYIIKEFFSNFFLYTSDVTFDLNNNEMIVHKSDTPDWKITLVETGLNTMTGGRIKRVKDYINNKPFMLTYGDGVADINVKELVKYHEKHGKLATLTAVQTGQRFGILDIDNNDNVNAFREKMEGDGSLINAGFMVLQPEVIDFIEDDQTTFEREPLEKIAQMGQLMAYRHHGFWQCMDTQRDKMQLEKMWDSGKAPWKIW